MTLTPTYSTQAKDLKEGMVVSDSADTTPLTVRFVGLNDKYVVVRMDSDEMNVSALYENDETLQVWEEVEIGNNPRRTFDEADMVAAYVAGFMSSGEGHNGEFQTEFVDEKNRGALLSGHLHAEFKSWQTKRDNEADAAALAYQDDAPTPEPQEDPDAAA